MIEIYAYRDQNIDVSISGLDVSLNGYTSKYYAKKNPSDTTFSVEVDCSIISDSHIIIPFTQTDSSLLSGDYLDELTVDSSTKVYTIFQNVLRLRGTVSGKH